MEDLIAEHEAERVTRKTEKHLMTEKHRNIPKFCVKTHGIVSGRGRAGWGIEKMGMLYKSWVCGGINCMGLST